MLFSTCTTKNNGVDSLEMRGISEDSRSESMTVGIALGERCSEMVLDITRVACIFNYVISVGMLALEFVKDLFKRLSNYVSQHVHAATMRHANNDLAYT